jgi:hypothetical protein
VAISFRWMRQEIPRTHPSRVRVGERVGVTVGGRVLEATVIEDRGNLGARGQQVVRLSVGDDGRAAAPPPYEVEMPVDWLHPPPYSRRKRR